ncbi:MAG: hypothetical protein KKA70_10760, partial [Proteobacteria bacterium]|nr:hypothetical protein [Pseudomonadota bacterium]
DVPDVVAMEDIVPLWEAGVMLAARNLDAFPRTIFTYIDDAAVPKDIAGKGVKFHADNAAWIKPYLGIKNNSTWSYLGSNHDERAANLIHYVAGYDPGSSKIDAATTNMRTRVVNGQVWKLGDIVNSTPVTVDGPPERFDVIYSDFGYHEFYEFHRNRADRETMVYVGGNDGMLHAFTSWQYDSRDKEFKLPPATFDGIGAELWGFIPQSLLPHLKWLPHQGYNHVYYVDLQPKVTAAQIFYNILGDPSSGTLVEPVGQEYHKNGWGVMLLGGLRMGGKDIKVTDDFDYDSSTADTTKTVTSSYFALDISNPRVPKVLWEKTFTDLEFTTSVPGIIKVGNKWYAVISSGPETYDGTSNKKGHVYILDLATGVPYQGTGPTDWFFETDHTDAFLSTAVGLDKRLNYNVDAVYFGEAHDTGNPDGWKGSAYRVGIPWVCSVADCTQVEYGDTVNGAYVTNPNDGLNPWYLSRLFDSPAPITAPVSLSIDGLSNAWVFFGTGRYFSQADKTTMDTQYLFGIKDPFFNRAYTTAPDDYYLNYTKNLTLDLSRFFDADTYKVSYPWGYIEAPAGDCSLVPTGQIGDIYGTGTIGETYSPGSCVCEYAWPAVSCTEVTVGRCAAVNPANELFDDGDCICIPFQVPQWGTVEYVVGGCAGVAEGRVGDVNSDGSCKGLYWRASGAVDISCLGVPFGTIGNPIPALYGGDGTCVGENVTVPAWNCTARPAGNCPDPAVDPDFYVGKTGDFLGDGGSCYSNYWRAREAVENSGACDSVDYTLHTGMFGPAGDGDYFGNGSCKTSFVPKEVPEAIVTNTTSNETLTFKEMLLLARATDGWVRILDIPGERSVTKPTLLGGAGLFTTYVPNTDICGFGGTSYLWGLYYESGTAYQKPILGTEIIDGVERPIEKLRLGVGMASSVAVHVGDQGGKSAKGFIQTSTGAMLGKDVETPLRIRSGFISWMEEE